MRIFAAPFAAPVVDTHSVTTNSTTITITGSVPSGSVVTGFVVEWQRDTSIGCSDMDRSSIAQDGDFVEFKITGLEEGNRYNITVKASNEAGIGPASNVVSAMTDETGETHSMSVPSPI